MGRKDLDRIPSKVALRFSVTSADKHSLQEKRQVLLGVVGDLCVEVSGRTLYREVQFPLVELAVALNRWLKLVGQTGESFVFTSMEAEESGLVWIKDDRGRWRIGSVHQEYEERQTFRLQEVKAVARAYIEQLTGELHRSYGIDISNLLDDDTGA